MGAINAQEASRIANFGLLQGSSLLELNQYRNVDSLAASIDQYNTSLLNANLDSTSAEILSNRNSSSFRARAAARGINVQSSSFNVRERQLNSELTRLFSMNQEMINRNRIASRLQALRVENTVIEQNRRIRGNILTDIGNTFLQGLFL